MVMRSAATVNGFANIFGPFQPDVVREPQGSRTEGLDRGELNHRARLAFRSLSPPGCLLPAYIALAQPAGCGFNAEGSGKGLGA
jgi:hypothetical protein